MLEAINSAVWWATAFLSSDPLKILYFVGGTGGLAYWYDRWRDRSRIHVRILSIMLDSHGGRLRVTVSFEATNLGRSDTAIQHRITCIGWDKESRTRVEFTLPVTQAKRKLAPHEPITLTADGYAPDDYILLYFKRFRFEHTRGRRAYVVAQPPIKPGVVPATLYRYRHWSFRLFGRLPPGPGKTT